MAFLKKFLDNPVFLVWFVVVVILFPILKPGFFSVHDETHIVDVYQMVRAFELGGFPPRFIPDVNFGLGYPYFNFYYHLPFYITTLLYLAGFSMVTSFKYMMGLAVILAAAGFYLFLRNHVSKMAATTGTLVYLLSPYFAVDLYVRGAFGELFIFALFSWTAYLLKEFLDRPNGWNLGLSSLAIGLLSISHNVLLPFAFTILFLYGLVNLLISKTTVKKYFKIFLPFLLGIGLAAYYLLPALAEVKFISSYEQFNIADHFPFIKQLIIPHWGYGPSIWGPLDDISFDVGTMNILLLVSSFFIFKLVSKQNRILLGLFWVITGVALILTNYRTLPFWESLKVLRLVQFPWRMLLVTTISTSFIAAVVIDSVQKFSKKNFLSVVLVLITALIVLNIWHYQPSEFKSTTDEEYLKRYFANRTLRGESGYLSQEYLNFTEDFIPPTIWQKTRPKEILDKVKFASGSGQLTFEPLGQGYKISYQTPVADKIIVAKTYFPGWEAKSDSGKLVVVPYSDYGIIAVPVGEGSGGFTLFFSDTPIRFMSNLLSAVSGLVILVLLVYSYSRRFK